MSDVLATFVRLRWALTWATMRRSVWQTIGYALGLCCGVGLVFGAVAAAIGVGLLPAWAVIDPADPTGSVPYLIMRSGVILGGGCVVVFAALIQLLLIGEGSTLTEQRFETYGIEDRSLQTGLIAAALSGAPSLFALAALLCWAFAYRWVSPGMVLMGVVCAPVAVLTAVMISRALIALATTLVATRRGRNLFYLILLIVFILACQTPNLLMGSGAVLENGAPGMRHFSTTAFSRMTDVLAWTPFAAPFALPFDLAEGAWAALAAHAAIIVLTWLCCFGLMLWCMGRRRLTAGADASGTVRGGLGDFARMPDSPSGAVSARLFAYLKRDPRQAPLLVIPAVMVAVFAIQWYGAGLPSIMVWQSLVWMGLLMMITEGNGLAYDGGGLTMFVLSGARGLADRIGRIRVFAVYAVAYLLALAFVVFALTGDWRTGQGRALGAACTLVGVGTAFAALGLAEIVSCVLPYPAPSIERPFSSPQGRMAAQGLFPLAHMLGTLLAMLPTGIAAIVMLLSGAFSASLAPYALGCIGLFDGTAALAFGTWLGGRLLDARAVALVRTIDEFASLQR